MPAVTTYDSIGWVMFLALLLPGLPGDPATPSTRGPSPETIQAFDDHIRATESRLQSQLQGENGYLWANTPERRRSARQGAVTCEPGSRTGEIKVPHGLVHDWVGSVFIPNATVDDVLSLVQNYDHHKDFYKPEVIDSQTLSRNGDDFQIRLRLLKKKVITVVLETEHDVHYRQLAPGWWQSRSYSTRIAEIQDYGGPRQRELPAGQDRGFLWKLNSYWTFRERDGGVYVECEGVSLTRSVPAGLGWLIEPIVRSLAKDSLVNTLRGTQAAVLKTKLPR